MLVSFLVLRMLGHLECLEAKGCSLGTCHLQSWVMGADCVLMRAERSSRVQAWVTEAGQVQD